MNHDDRLFPSEPAARKVARALYATVRDLPIISPHGHTDARWFAEDMPFPDPTTLLIQPDHYIFRMLYSQGISMESLGIPGPATEGKQVDPRAVWRIFAKHYYLFRGTPTRMWLDFVFSQLFGQKTLLSEKNADEYYDAISAELQKPEFRPRALFDRFNIAALATTDAAVDDLKYHQAIKNSGWKGRILPTFRPDAVVDAEYAGFKENLDQLGAITKEDTSNYKGYLNALRSRHSDRPRPSDGHDRRSERCRCGEALRRHLLRQGG